MGELAAEPAEIEIQQLVGYKWYVPRTGIESSTTR